MILKCETGEFEITEEMKDIIEKLGTPYSAGIFLKKKNPSLHEIMLGKKKIPKIFVDQRAEKKFIYGKNIPISSIVKKQTDSGVFLVCGSEGDILGIGVFDGDYVKNLADIGLYLRKE